MFQFRTKQFLKTKELLKEKKEHQYSFFLLIDCKNKCLSVLKKRGSYSKQISQDIFTEYSNKAWVSQKFYSHSVRHKISYIPRVFSVQK